MTPKKLSLMIVAGEPSGDAHGASLVRALHEAAPDVSYEFFGSAGPLMREAGVESVVRADDLAIMGILEVARVFPRFLRAFRQLKRAAFERRPDAVILVDWPEFNLRLARALHRDGLRVIYYISPQVWAWRSYRVRNLRRDIDLLLSILPFEKEWFAERGMNEVEFVGHPLAGEVHAKFDRAEFCRRTKLDPKLPIITLLPGSRRKEIERILPLMLEAAALISARHPQIQFVVVVAPSRSSDEIRKIVRAQRSLPEPLPSCLHIVIAESREALAASDAAAVASGTATLEAALLETPMVVVYKESVINWHVLGSLINVDHYGLVNLVAGERVVTELMQNELTGDRLATELVALLDHDQNAEVRERLHEVAEQLGAGGASQRAAELVLAKVQEWKTPLWPEAEREK
ncbi:MAG: lipid-A-disaccharide synthase [Blastocatellia bacterium]|jgi:lipid-A-disaccharide synthase|nr:lipid-A-disaccharide synthase [Blastocatellia bacterium]